MKINISVVRSFNIQRLILKIASFLRKNKNNKNSIEKGKKLAVFVPGIEPGTFSVLD